MLPPFFVKWPGSKREISSCERQKIGKDLNIWTFQDSRQSSGRTKQRRLDRAPPASITVLFAARRFGSPLVEPKTSKLRHSSDELWRNRAFIPESIRERQLSHSPRYSVSC
jgi:hypothetical protein